MSTPCVSLSEQMNVLSVMFGFARFRLVKRSTCRGETRAAFLRPPCGTWSAAVLLRLILFCVRFPQMCTSSFAVGPTFARRWYSWIWEHHSSSFVMVGARISFFFGGPAPCMCRIHVWATTNRRHCTYPIVPCPNRTTSASVGILLFGPVRTNP